jgi:hypothetical protein
MIVSNTKTKMTITTEKPVKSIVHMMGADLECFLTMGPPACIISIEESRTATTWVRAPADIASPFVLYGQGRAAGPESGPCVARS